MFWFHTLDKDSGLLNESQRLSCPDHSFSPRPHYVNIPFFSGSDFPNYAQTSTECRIIFLHYNIGKTLPTNICH